MKRSWDSLLTVTLLSCALITTALVVRRELLAPDVRVPPQKPTFIRDWHSLIGQGVRLGPADAPVKLIEFADFECPFCATLHQTLKTVRARYPGQIELSYVHYPLQMHRFALPAARVAECADAQGRFEAVHDRLFEEQSQFGLKPWTELVKEADIPDLASFETCIQSTAPVSRIEAGKQLAKKLNIRGTPTLIVNGWRLVQPPTVEQLDEMIEAVLKGKSPLPVPDTSLSDSASSQ